ncbi:unnamed protein product [Durusdinium trenchii]|uniref:Photosystem I PsaL reaction centre subunit XI domain-containing protein n=1 Tax=Durusdinium trenchii TaxID=1381693 RepID=A0ABP0SAM7_9DINO|eukprot:g17695.t2
MECKVSFAVPGPAGYFFTGAIFQWKGKEPFAGDQMQTLLENGYFLIGPFTSLGPLRNTPEAATGLLCGAIVGLVSVGGLIFGSTIKPTRFDKEGDKPAASLGGAVFAPALITIFGS